MVGDGFKLDRNHPNARCWLDLGAARRGECPKGEGENTEVGNRECIDLTLVQVTDTSKPIRSWGWTTTPGESWADTAGGQRFLEQSSHLSELSGRDNDDNGDADRPPHMGLDCSLKTEFSELAIRPTPDAACACCLSPDPLSRQADLSRHARAGRKSPVWSPDGCLDECPNCRNCNRVRARFRNPRYYAAARRIARIMEVIVLGCGGAATIAITNFNQAFGQGKS